MLQGHVWGRPNSMNGCMDRLCGEAYRGAEWGQSIRVGRVAAVAKGSCIVWGSHGGFSESQLARSSCVVKGLPFPSARATLTSGGASWCRSPLLGTVAAAPAPTHDSWRNLGSSATTRACAVPATSAAGAVAARTAGVRRSVSAAAAVAARGSIAPRLLSTALARSASFNGALPLLTRTCVPSTPARSH
eukprot:359586-Chlamydomonas_euryale.AAC.3